ncbi:hypothetical protein V8E51_006137 [Hyaloscypha variabilis]
MQLPDLQFAFYFLSPTFVSSALILLVLFALASLLMNTISYSKIAVAHMLIFLFSTIFIPAIPVAVDILLLAFIVIATIKTAGKLFSMLAGPRHTIDSIFGLDLTFLCLTIVLDVIFSDTEGFGWSGVGEFSVVVRGIRGIFIEAGVDLDDVALRGVLFGFLCSGGSGALGAGVVCRT